MGLPTSTARWGNTREAAENSPSRAEGDRLEGTAQAVQALPEATGKGKDQAEGRDGRGAGATGLHLGHRSRRGATIPSYQSASSCLETVHTEDDDVGEAERAAVEEAHGKENPRGLLCA